MQVRSLYANNRSAIQALFVLGMEMKVFYTAIHIYMVYADSAEKQVVYFIWDI